MSLRNRHAEKVSELVTNIESALEILSPATVRKTVSSVLGKTAPALYENILRLVAKEFKITKTKLVSKNLGLVDAKQAAACLLKIHLQLSVRTIATNLSSRTKQVQIGLDRCKNANPKILIDRKFLEKIDRINKKIEKTIEQL